MIEYVGEIVDPWEGEKRMKEWVSSIILSFLCFIRLNFCIFYRKKDKRSRIMKFNVFSQVREGQAPQAPLHDDCHRLGGQRVSHRRDEEGQSVEVWVTVDVVGSQFAIGCFSYLL